MVGFQLQTPADLKCRSQAAGEVQQQQPAAAPAPQTMPLSKGQEWASR
jgi:hypothetical protein